MLLSNRKVVLRSSIAVWAAEWTKSTNVNVLVELGVELQPVQSLFGHFL